MACVFSKLFRYPTRDNVAHPEIANLLALIWRRKFPQNHQVHAAGLRRLGRVVAGHRVICGVARGQSLAGANLFVMSKRTSSVARAVDNSQLEA